MISTWYQNYKLFSSCMWCTEWKIVFPTLKMEADDSSKPLVPIYQNFAVSHSVSRVEFMITSVTTWNRADSRSGKDSEFYFGGAWFISRPGHRIFWQVSSVTSGKFRDSMSNRLCLLHSKSFLIHLNLSSHYWTLCNVDIEIIIIIITINHSKRENEISDGMKNIWNNRRSIRFNRAIFVFG
jgi:hypothetical protein